MNMEVDARGARRRTVVEDVAVRHDDHGSLVAQDMAVLGACAMWPFAVRIRTRG